MMQGGSGRQQKPQDMGRGDHRGLIGFDSRCADPPYHTVGIEWLGGYGALGGAIPQHAFCQLSSDGQST